ncbi:hypothetical protein BH09SUM1_BH09SUM1_30460 [soil metagenome]
MTSSRPHVLQVIRSFAADGPNRLLLSLLRQWSPEDLRVSLVALSGGDASSTDNPLAEKFEEEIDRLGGQVRMLSAPWLRMGPARAELVKICRDSEITHIHAHLVRADILSRKAASLAGLPYIFTEHGIHAWSEGPRGTGPLVRIWYRNNLSRDVCIVAVSDKVARNLLAEKVPAERIKTISNGVDVQRYMPATAQQRAESRTRFGVASDAFPVMALVGGLTANKMPQLALRTLKELNAAEGLRSVLFVCGKGPLKEALLEEAKSAGVQKLLKFTGLQKDPLPVFHASDLLIHPSVQESFGLTVAEALACGLPAVVREGSGADETAGPRPTGWLATGNDPVPWANVVRKCCDELRRDADLIQNAARLRAETNFDIANTAKAYLRLYAGA